MSRLAIVVALASAALFACAQSAGHPRASVSDSREVPTSALGSMTSVRVTFHHDGSTPNAAIVFLHGVGGSETTWSELRGSESVAAALRESQGPALNILVVAVAGDSLGWPEHLDGSVSWKRFLTAELPEYLRSAFGEDLTSRRIAYLGTSAGGNKAITMAFQSPASFKCVAAHSPALHPSDPSELPAWAREWEGWRPLYGVPIDRARWQSDNALHLAATVDRERLSGLGLYFDAGVDDHLGFQKTAAQLSATLSRRAVPHEFALRPGGHGNAYTEANLARSLSFLIRCLGEAVAESSSGDRDG